jgi:hypothetical protein
MIRQLRYRSFILKCWAGISVFLIVGSLLLGILVFVAADKLVSNKDLIEEVQAKVDEIRKKEPESKRVAVEIGPDLNATISATATRIGAVLILVFLAKVLVNLYRENARFAAFYDRLADAIQLWGTNLEALEKFVPLLELDELVGDKTLPKSPVEELASLVKSLGLKLKAE